MEFYGAPWKQNLMDLRGVPWNHHGISMEVPWNICGPFYGSFKYCVSWNVTQLCNERQRVNYQHILFKEGQFIFMCQGIY